MNEDAHEATHGRLIARIDVGRGKTKCLEIRIQPADEMHRFATLLVVRHMIDGRFFSFPIHTHVAREFAHMLDVAIGDLEDIEIR